MLLLDHVKGGRCSSSPGIRLTEEVIPEFSGVGQGLEDTVHEAGVAQVDQASKTRQTHFLLLLVFMLLLAGREAVGHGLHHAGGFGLNRDRGTGEKQPAFIQVLP